jgi:hypothetical protein
MWSKCVWLATQASGPLAQLRHVFLQAEMAETRIEKQITVAPAHMPHIAAVEGLDPGLVNEGDIIAEVNSLIPFMRFGDLKLSHS